jgi:bacterioferritin-associated ferredoxin
VIVCVCRRVSDRQIRDAVRDGADSLEHLQIDLGVAMQCGRCAECATRVLCDARAAQHAKVAAATSVARAGTSA